MEVSMEVVKEENHEEKEFKEHAQLVWQIAFDSAECISRNLVLNGLDPVAFYEQYLETAKKEKAKLFAVMNQQSNEQH